ncbi:hypothetical protein [Nocardia rhizosphaerihabitans]|uniref:DUF5671 domain-containing protein n=1 Tax=Nocardia rhizosphaerihabitans TaxID=1691570 RepID=A0ABQ2KPZ6_9NOCA|nr:hypothetical protein [Nocardia rhizosphaerihabitans]GGN86585.1 hypothetical protein GCM10011610_42050 [Nocardia rhizosphaerihabitans]
MSTPSSPTPTVAVDKWIGVVAGVVAPTTVITGLCYYFGFVSARAYFAYFGVDTESFQYSTTDYVLRSVSVLYPALVIALVVSCAMFTLRAYERRSLRKVGRSPLALRGGWAAMVAGAILTALAVLGVIAPRFSVLLSTTLIPVALAVGALLIVAGSEALAALRSGDTPRSATPAQRSVWMFAGAAIVLAAFWLTNIFATEYGRQQAQNAAADLWDKETVVTLDTTEPLFAPSNLVLETPLGTQPGQRFAYRYECLRTLVVRPDRWVLVPARWTVENGYSLIIPIDDSSRISLTKLNALSENKKATDWKAPWQCPEIAPL